MIFVAPGSEEEEGEGEEGEEEEEDGKSLQEGDVVGKQIGGIA